MISSSTQSPSFTNQTHSNTDVSYQNTESSIEEGTSSSIEHESHVEKFLKKISIMLDRRGSAKSYLDEGDYFYFGKHYKEALPCYTEALRRYRELPEKYLPKGEFVACLTRVAYMLEVFGRLPEALSHYEEAFQIHKNYPKRNKLDLASYFHDFGTVLLKLGCFAEARTKFEEALSLCKEEYGSNSGQEVAYSLKTLSSVLSAMGNYKEALLYIEEAIALSKRLPPDSGDLISLNFIVQFEKSHVLASLHRYYEALAISEELLQQQKENYGSSAHRNLIDCLQVSGNMLKALKRYCEAAEKYKEALVLQEQLYGEEEKPEKAITLNMLGIVLRLKGDLTSALECHQQAFQILEHVYGKTPNHLVGSTLNYLTIVLAQLNYKEEATECFIRASDINSALSIPGAHPINATTLHNTVLNPQQSSLDELYASYDEACQVLRNPNFYSESSSNLTGKPGVLVLQEKLCSQLKEFLSHPINIDNSVLAVTKTCKNLGIKLRSLGRLHEAKECIEKSLEIYRIAFSEIKDHSEIANCLDSLGGVLRDLGHLKEAKLLIEQAFEMRKRLCCPETPEQSISLENLESKTEEIKNNFELLQNYAQLTNAIDNLGNLHRELGFFKDAKKYISLALKLRKRLFPPDHENNIVSLNSVATLLREIGKFDKALKYHEEALKLAGPKVQTLNGLGLTLLELGDTDKAMQRFREAHKILRYMPSHSDENREIVSSVENLGHCLGYLGKFHEAVHKHKIACQMQANYFGQDSYQVANALCNIGFYLHRLGNYDEELENYKQALAIQKSVFGENHLVVANTLDNIGSCLAKLGKYEAALEVHRHALAIRKEVFHEKHPLVALTLDNLGLCHSYSGNNEESLKHFQEALAIRQACYDEDHPLIKLSLSYIETCKNVISPLVRSESIKDGNQTCLSKEEFEKLVEYARQYLDNTDAQKKFILEKNPTGFVRLRLPVPKELTDRVETIRLNYWLPNIKITVVEAPHDHPRYFESMIIKGGYTHQLFRKQINETAATVLHVASRIFKSNHLDRRNIFSVGKINLESLGNVDVKKGNMVAFPRSLIHQVLETKEGTMSINCVFKNPENRNYYDVFMPKDSPQDPQVDRDVLMSDECDKIISDMKSILNAWSQEKQQEKVTTSS